MKFLLSQGLDSDYGGYDGSSDTSLSEERTRVRRRRRRRLPTARPSVEKHRVAASEAELADAEQSDIFAPTSDEELMDDPMSDDACSAKSSDLAATDGAESSDGAAHAPAAARACAGLRLPGDPSTYGVRAIDITGFGKLLWSFGRSSCKVQCGFHSDCGFSRTLRASDIGRMAQGRPCGLFGYFLMHGADFADAHAHRRWLRKKKGKQRHRVQGRAWLQATGADGLPDLFRAERPPRATEAAEPRGCP
jgi:hypothetical protein